MSLSNCFTKQLQLLRKTIAIASKTLTIASQNNCNCCISREKFKQLRCNCRMTIAITMHIFWTIVMMAVQFHRKAIAKQSRLLWEAHAIASCTWGNWDCRDCHATYPHWVRVPSIHRCPQIQISFMAQILCNGLNCLIWSCSYKIVSVNGFMEIKIISL